MTDYYVDHIKSAFEAISIYEGDEVFQRTFHQWPTYIGDLVATHWILTEVYNGGFLQFFLNPTGILAPEAAEGFDRMGLTDASKLVREAMAFFGSPYPREQEEREIFHARQYGYVRDSEDLSTPFLHNPSDHLDDQFYKLGTKGDETASYNGDNFYDRMNAYATQHGL